MPQPGRPRTNAASATGVIQIRGTISQHAEGDLSSFLFGGATTEAIGQALDEMLADDSISKIVLDIDSPGGSSYGVSELANKIMAARGRKPIVAVANSVAASAAYWIGSAADQFFMTPGGLVGSIGVYAMHQDVSQEFPGVKTTFISAGKFKTAGNEWEPLDDDTRDRVQGRVDTVYSQFIRDVARGRGVEESVVREGYGQGDVLTAKQAKAEGMVDGVLTLDEVLAKSFKLAEPAAAMAALSSDLETQTEHTPPQVDEEADKRLARMRVRSFQARAAACSAV